MNEKNMTDGQRRTAFKALVQKELVARGLDQSHYSEVFSDCARLHPELVNGPSTPPNLPYTTGPAKSALSYDGYSVRKPPVEFARKNTLQKP